MSCTNCQRVKNLYTCLNQLTIGTANPPEPEEGYMVYFESAPTGKIATLGAESNINGVIFISEFTTEFLADSDYKVWVSHGDPTNAQESIPILIDDVEFECFLLRFERIYQSDNVTVTGLDQVLEIA